MIGKLLALPFRIANAPIRAGEKILAKMCGDDDIPPGDRLASVPLESMAKALEEIDREEGNQ